MVAATAESEDSIEEIEAEEIRFIACKPLRVGASDDGQYITRQINEEVPEVATWSPLTVQRYIQEGHIRTEKVRARGRGRPRK